jgi:hypothetical protein
MATQNTDNVMSCELGKWFSDDKKTAFKVLERTEQSTSIKLTFGNETNKSSEPTIINNEEVWAAKEDEEVEIGAGITEGEPQSISENTNNVTKDQKQNECDDNLCQEETEPSIADQNRTLKSFLADHGLLLIGLSLLNLTMALLITILCFICPTALEDLRNWTKAKLDVGLSMGSKGVQIGIKPFTWMWRFLNCVGKCFGFRMPDMSLPSLSAYMPKWFSCVLSCFSSEEDS